MPVYGFGYGFDMWYVILVIPALLLSLWAQIRVKSTFSKYSKRSVISGMTGHDASLLIQQNNGISVGFGHVSGSLSDFYDPKTNTVNLSDTVDTVSSVAAVGVAAHETGHALQYVQSYLPVKIRMAMVPVTNIASSISPWLVILGLVLNFFALSYVGIVLFTVAVLFQLVTLPVEFNASARALRALKASNRFSEDELKGVKKVLTAAALTYVAALFVSLMNLLRFVMMVAGRRNNRR